MNELKITKEKVLEAASKWPTAKQALQTLFPEAFESDKYFDLTADGLYSKDCRIYDNKKNGITISIAIAFAPYGLVNRCFFLSSDVNWELTDSPFSPGNKILIPTKK